MDATNLPSNVPVGTTPQTAVLTDEASDNNNAAVNQSDSQVHAGTSRAKELEPQLGLAESSLLTEVAKDIELPKEVHEAGVQVIQHQQPPSPVSVTIPTVQNVPTQLVVPVEEEIVLPISDDKIALGLSKGVFTSWRWLSTWCTRKLKQAHRVLKNVHGHIIRNQT